MEKELELRQYVAILKKRWALIVFLPLLAGLVAGLLSFYALVPVYQASTTLIVGQKLTEGSQVGELFDYNTLLANQQLAKTYGAIAKSRTVEEKVIKDLNLALTVEELDEKITVNPVKNTEILEISVTDEDPYMSARIANSLALSFSEAVIEIKKVDSVSTVDRAVVPTTPVEPNKKLNVLLAMVAGMVLGVALALAREYFDNTIKTAKDVERILDLPILGLIPTYQKE